MLHGNDDVGDPIGTTSKSNEKSGRDCFVIKCSWVSLQRDNPGKGSFIFSGLYWNVRFLWSCQYYCQY